MTGKTASTDSTSLLDLRLRHMIAYGPIKLFCVWMFCSLKKKKKVRSPGNSHMVSSLFHTEDLFFVLTKVDDFS